MVTAIVSLVKTAGKSTFVVRVANPLIMSFCSPLRDFRAVATYEKTNRGSVGNNIKYKCTDCTDYSPSFLTQTDHGPYPN